MTFKVKLGDQKCDVIVTVLKKPYLPSLLWLDPQKEVYAIFACDVVRDNEMLQSIGDPALKGTAYCDVNIGKPVTQKE